MQNAFACILQAIMPEDLVPKSWAPDKMVRVLTDCMVKDFQFHFHDLREAELTLQSFPKNFECAEIFRCALIS
jgi:hypothetical protein